MVDSLGSMIYSIGEVDGEDAESGCADVRRER